MTTKIRTSRKLRRFLLWNLSKFVFALLEVTNNNIQEDSIFGNLSLVCFFGGVGSASASSACVVKTPERVGEREEKCQKLEERGGGGWHLLQIDHYPLPCVGQSGGVKFTVAVRESLFEKRRPSVHRSVSRKGKEEKLAHTAATGVFGIFSCLFRLGNRRECCSSFVTLSLGRSVGRSAPPWVSKELLLHCEWRRERREGGVIGQINRTDGRRTEEAILSVSLFSLSLLPKILPRVVRGDERYFLVWEEGGGGCEGDLIPSLPPLFFHSQIFGNFFSFFNGNFLLPFFLF